MSDRYFASFVPFTPLKLAYLTVGFASSVVFVLGIHAMSEDLWMKALTLFTSGVYIEISFYCRLASFTIKTNDLAERKEPHA